jgi:hypothetical protein
MSILKQKPPKKLYVADHEIKHNALEVKIKGAHEYVLSGFDLRSLRMWLIKEGLKPNPTGMKRWVNVGQMIAEIDRRINQGSK